MRLRTDRTGLVIKAGEVWPSQLFLGYKGGARLVALSAGTDDDLFIYRLPGEKRNLAVVYTENERMPYGGVEVFDLGTAETLYDYFLQEEAFVEAVGGAKSPINRAKRLMEAWEG